MAKTGFSRVEQTGHRPGYGPRVIMACGYSPAERETLLGHVGRSALAGVPVIFADARQAESIVADVLASTGGPADRQDADPSPALPRAILLSGVSHAELCAFMDGWKTLGLPAQLWAMLTPVSERWSLSRLLRELDRERRAMESRRGRRRVPHKH